MKRLTQKKKKITMILAEENPLMNWYSEFEMIVVHQQVLAIVEDYSWLR